LSGLSDLYVIAINIEGCPNITDKSIQSLLDNKKGIVKKNADSLKQFTFSFNFKSSGITSIGRLALFNVIAEMKKLTLLSLRFGGIVKANEVQALSTSLSNTEALKTLKLDLDLDVSAPLASALSNLAELKTLDFDFKIATWPEDVADYLLIETAGALKKMNNLVSLSLNLEEAKITDSGLNIFSECVAQVETLTTLHFQVANAKGVTNAHLAKFGTDLQSLPKLSNVEFNYSGCSAISDEGVKNLINPISQIQTLFTINLKIYKCYSVTKETIDSLRASVAYPKMLHILS